MAYTFGAEDILSAIGLTAADCEVQESGSGSQTNYAITKDKDGLNVASAETAYDKRTEKTITVKTKAPSGATASFNLGGVGTNNVVITSFSVRKVYNDNASMTVTAHIHTDTETGAVHLATPVDEAVEVTLGFGIDAVLLGETLKDCQSQELSGSIEHVDKLSNAGKFLVGASTGLKFECTEEYVDDGTTITISADWSQDSQDVKTSNGDFYTRTIKGHTFVNPVPPAGP